MNWIFWLLWIQYVELDILLYVWSPLINTCMLLMFYGGKKSLLFVTWSTLPMNLSKWKSLKIFLVIYFPKGGVSLDVTKMNHIVEVNKEDFDCTVQPGVMRKALNNYLRDTGLWFPIGIFSYLFYKVVMCQELIGKKFLSFLVMYVNCSFVLEHYPCVINFKKCRGIAK